MTICVVERIKNEDYFNLDVQTLVNPVNCLGVMGAGLALQFKRRYPAMYDQYRQDCLNGLYEPGKLMLWKESDVHYNQVINFPTKKQWQAPSKLEYIEAGLVDFVNRYKDFEIVSVAFPRLGCGFGGLKWDDVQPLMYKYLDQLIDIQVVLCE